MTSHSPSASRLSRRDLLGACAALGAVDAWGAATIAAADGGAPVAAGRISWSPPRRRGGGWLEWRLATSLGGTPAQYMDPSSFDLWCEFEGPAGVRRRVSTFWCEDDRGSDWVIRFLPPTAGRWRMQPMARLAGGAPTVLGASATFQVEEVIARQHIRVDPQTPTHFAFDDGTPFIPINLNIC